MDTQLSIQDFSEGRKKISISISLSEDETKEMERKNCQRHIDSPCAFPTQTYQSPDPKIKTVVGIPKWNGTPYKTYFLQNARRVLLNRPIAGKTHTRIPFPGEFDLGFINPIDEDKIIKWWLQTKPHVINELKRLIFAVNAESSEFKPSASKTIGAESVNLNPLNPAETGGVRKRCLDVY
jgi:hypothetical protein